MSRLARRRRAPLRRPGLKFVMGSLAAGVLAMPVAIALIVALILSTTTPRSPMLRLQYLNRELLLAADYESGRIQVKPGYHPPEGLELILEDEEGSVLLSTIGDFAVGSKASLEEIAAALRSDSSIKDFFAESVRAMSGATIGRYFAWYTSGFHPSRERSSPGPLLALVGLFALAFSVGSIVAAQLARAVLGLERAAGKIAAGDLASEVEVRGIREIEDLARAMDGMRATLREDRDQRARFLAAVSHDLRTPLTSIGGYLEAVEDGLASDPETLERYVGIMRDKTRLLEGRIASLIEFARVETGEWRMSFEKVELRPLLEGIAREFREDAALLGRSLCFDFSALGPFTVEVDRALITRAFENLVSNACRYSPLGSSLRMGARKAEGGGFVVDIDDEGPGVAPPERERIFEAFVRGGSAREGEGSGLGLYIARSVVRGHGWDIKAGEAPGGGGRFSISIPAARKPERLE